MQDPNNATILVVEDDQVLREAIVFDLSRRKFKVLSAENGSIAFELVKANKIDVIISDIRMPGGDGVELLEKVKAMSPEIPIVLFVTGFADLSLEDAYDKGADAVFAKPFDRKALIATIFKSLSPKNEQWAGRKTERIETEFEVSLSFPELNLTTKGRVLNIGRGGMFLALQKHKPSVGVRTIFTIQFAEGPLKKIEGQGIVRWVRQQESPEWPSGCGIEFEFLAEDIRGEIIELINIMKTKSFIPKS